MGFTLRWFGSFLHSQLLVTPPSPTKDFSGQTIIVTGSNTGLGLEAARHFSRLNAAFIILAVRNREKGEKAKKFILESTGKTKDSIEVWDLDMQSYESIKAFCARATDLPRLDVVVENAGIVTKYFKIVASYESIITTNVIGTFLLALGLLPKLKQTSLEFNTLPRLSIVASDVHFIANFAERNSEDIFAALNDKNSVLGMERYSVSKLIQVFGVRELASRANGDASPTVIINCLTPGLCESDFDRESTGLATIMNKAMNVILARSTEVGSRTIVIAAAAGEESNGAYMADGVIAETSDLVQGTEGPALQKKIWEQMVAQLEIIQPGISRNLWFRYTTRTFLCGLLDT